MLEPLEYRGLWWLPEEPDQPVAGVLTFSQEDVGLELFGQLPRTGPEPDPGTREIRVPAGPLSRERILGLSTDGKSFTLESCHATGWNLVSSGLVTERFAPSIILRGAHYAPGEAILFDELSVRYTQLDAWVATTGITWSGLADEERPTGFDIAFRPPDPVKVQLSDAALEVDFSWTFNTGEPLRPEVTLRQRAAFVVRVDKPIPLERSLELSRELRNFVALGVGRPVTPVAISGFVLPPSDAEPDPFTDLPPRKLRIDLFYRLGQVPEVKDVHPWQMLFTLADARERFAQLLENWLGKQNLLRPVVDLYFGAIYNREAFLEQQFLSLMQAIETFHRRTSLETDLPPDDHERRVTEILATTPEEHRDWLAGRLTYSNELTLRKRLRDILKRCPEVATKLVGKRKGFIQRVGIARNYLTHYDEALEEEAPKGLDLYPLTIQLQALVELCLLLELGFDCGEIDSFFERVGRYREAQP
jgi:hypothetical protein